MPRLLSSESRRVVAFGGSTHHDFVAVLTLTIPMITTLAPLVIDGHEFRTLRDLVERVVAAGQPTRITLTVVLQNATEQTTMIGLASDGAAPITLPDGEVLVTAALIAGGNVAGVRYPKQIGPEIVALG